MCPPKFVQGLDADLSVKDGDMLHMSCTVRGDPEPTISWHKNGEVFVTIILYLNS